MRKKATRAPRSYFTRFVKPEENPLIVPEPQHDWEAWQTFNPGVVSLSDVVHFLYRAIGGDGISRLGYASSPDGLTVRERLPHPVYEHRVKDRVWSVYSFASGGSWGGCEDARIVRVGGEDTLYMTYTACDDGLRVGLTSIGVDDFLHKRWTWKAPMLISPPGQVHKNWVLFPEKIRGKYALLHSINPSISIAYLDSLDFPPGQYIESEYGGGRRRDSWDTFVRGAGAPPLKTPRGWLLFYHAIDEYEPGKYKVGAMLLDLEDPTHVLYRAPEPILEPDAVYENDGFKRGVVYASGAVVKDGVLYLYYGGADSYVCAAYGDFDTFMDELTREKRPTLRRRILEVR